MTMVKTELGEMKKWLGEKTFDKATYRSLQENQEMRDKLVERVEVLNKVKKLFLIPDLDVMTVGMVADYFESDVSTVRKIYQRNKAEIDKDGVVKRPLSYFKSFFEGKKILSKTMQGYLELSYDDVVIKIPNSGVNIFPQRAILRIAMLFSSSEIAKEVRTQLLNTFDHSTISQRTADIDEENTLLLEVGRAYMLGSVEDIQVADRNYLDFKNRHIRKLESENVQLANKNKELESENDILANGIMTWGAKEIINALIRSLAYNRYHRDFKSAWRTLYKEVKYSLHIDVYARSGSGGYINRVKPNEIDKVATLAAAICKRHHLNVGKIINEINAENINEYESEAV